MKRFLVLLVGFLMLGAGFIFSEPPSGKGTPAGKGNPAENRGEDVGNVREYLNIREELNLTDEQVKALEKIRTDYRRDAIQRQADVKLARMDLREILRQDKPDYAAAKSKTKQVSELQLASKLAMIDAMEKGYNVLTKAQQEKLPQLKKERRETWKRNKMGAEK
ncbi:MAG TPA: hypothetical protein DCX95_03295 [Elusimicrobia bacterium]|nr:hypothetical protein [Elusimicrobiota bacterium]